MSTSICEELSKYRVILSESTKEKNEAACEECEKFPCVCDDTIKEAWDKKMKTPASKKGMFKGKTKAELRSELSAAKKKAEKHHKDGTKEPEALKTKIKELEFALRAKNSFGKVSESVKTTRKPGPFARKA